ncbi:hypothetical protein C8R45DRAFT_1212716 [Mycena sanguinolenta]|nr:hypothetical protein C8R45DRAFT_1212716 [Mycena sanguinolenta]
MGQQRYIGLRYSSYPSVKRNCNEAALVSRVLRRSLLFLSAALGAWRVTTGSPLARHYASTNFFSGVHPIARTSA